MYVNETSGRNERSPRKLWHQPVLLTLDTPLVANVSIGKSRHHRSKVNCISQAFLQISRCLEEWLIYGYILDKTYEVGCGKKIKWLGSSRRVNKSDYEVSCKKAGNSLEAKGSGCLRIDDTRLHRCGGYVKLGITKDPVGTQQ